MEQSDLLRHLVSALEGLGLRYFVTGSMATILYGEPRQTNDIDVVVDLASAKVGAFCSAFPASEFYLSEEAVRDAVRPLGQFDIIHPASGLKLDVIIPQLSAFDRGRLARAVRVHPAEDYQAMFASPEDVILKKMESYRDGGSEKHLRDITGVLKISGDRIDRDYIRDWSNRLGVSEIWRAILDRLGP